MIEFQAVMVSQGLKGLKFLDVSALDLSGHGTQFFEVVLSAHNHFVGRTADRDNSDFSKYYDGCSVVAVRRRGRVDATNPAAVSASLSVSRHAMNMSKHIVRSMNSNLGTMAIPEHKSEDNMEQGVLSSLPSFAPSSDKEIPSSGSTETTRTSARGDSPSPLEKTRPHVPFYIPPRSAIPPQERKQVEEGHVTESPFQAGDTVLVLAKEDFMEKQGASKDFLLVTKVGSVPKPVETFDYVPLLVFLGMLVWVLLGADMVSKRPTERARSSKCLRPNACTLVGAPATLAGSAGTNIFPTGRPLYFRHIHDIHGP